MIKKVVLATALLFLHLFLSGQEKIERIEIEGNERITRETILYYLFMKEGGYFNKDSIKEDFKSLWSTGFFSNVKIEESEGSKGRILKISVEENPFVRSIIFKTGKKLKEKDIISSLKEKNEYLLTYSFYSLSRIERIKKTIEELLLERGFQQGEVNVDLNKNEKNAVKVIFHIKEGTRFKVGEVVFEERPGIREKVLRGAMKENRKHGIVSWIKGKDIFRQNRLEQDLASIRSKLEEHGYMKATIGEPRIEEVEKRTIFFKRERMKKIIITIDAGCLYKVGKVQVEGNKAISKEALKRFLVGFKEGEIYSAKIRDEIREEMQRLYQEKGYLYARVIPVEHLDSERGSVNVIFSIDEGELTYLSRLELRGNILTKDKVIRREMLIKEGDRFNFSLFEKSLFRIQHLGIAELENEPEIKPIPKDRTQIDVSLHIKELQKGYIHFSGGYNDYSGVYGGIDFGTANFLGAGKHLDLGLDYGERIKNFVFGFSEPYFLNHPSTLGFDIYYRDMIFPHLDYKRKGKGADLAFQTRIQDYWRASFIYSYENVTVEPPGGSEDESSLDPIYLTMFGLGSFNLSSFFIELGYSTVNSRFIPTRGISYSFSSKFAGAFLGGDVNLIKPRFELSFFLPSLSNHVFGFHSEYQFVKALGDSQLPFWERLYLGGRKSVRGFRAYSIGPRSERGTNIAGDRSILFNVEYIIPVVEPFYAVLFYDTGNAYAPGQKMSFRNMYSSTGLEMRISFSAERAPLRLIFAYNNRKIYAHDSHFRLLIAFGTTF